uniref:N-acetyltransferase domain-containing protein n=1 Tax=viral metagenome TaxID=1070528 RepID=A0A6C0JLA4_9ZZZZ
MNMDIDTTTENNVEYTTLVELLQQNLIQGNFQHITKQCFHSNFSHIKSQYLQLLSFLTNTETMSNEDFYKKVCEISKLGTIVVCYIKPDIIIGTGTIMIEPKIIHGGKYVGHIEDVVVHPLYRNKKVAKGIISKLVSHGNKCNCYKIILDCNSNLQSFYEKLGFQNKNIQMSIYK